MGFYIIKQLVSYIYIWNLYKFTHRENNKQQHHRCLGVEVLVRTIQKLIWNVTLCKQYVWYIIYWRFLYSFDSY